MTDHILQVEIAKIYGEIKLVNKELEMIRELLDDQVLRLGDRLNN